MAKMTIQFGKGVESTGEWDLGSITLKAVKVTDSPAEWVLAFRLQRVVGRDMPYSIVFTKEELAELFQAYEAMKPALAAMESWQVPTVATWPIGPGPVTDIQGNILGDAGYPPAGG